MGPHPPEWFSHDCISMFQKTYISEGFKYLGIIASDNSCVLDDNYDITLDTVPGILSGLPHRPTCISGRVLHLKQLVVSKFVYKFQLLPTPNFRKLQLLNSSLFNYVWNYGCHRLRQELVSLPKHDGGFDMVNIFVANKALKFTWFNRLFKDTANTQFWTAFLYHIFVIPLPEVLNCNLHPSNLKWILSPQAIIPPFWHELFTFWFNQFYIPPNCTDDDKKDKVLNVPVTYNSSIFSPLLLPCNMPKFMHFHLIMPFCY